MLVYNQILEIYLRFPLEIPFSVKIDFSAALHRGRTGVNRRSVGTQDTYISIIAEQRIAISCIHSAMFR